MSSTYLPISRRRQLRANQIPFVREQEKSAALRSDVDARAIFLRRHAVRAPKLFAGARLQTDQFAWGLAAVDILPLRHGGGGVAQDPSRRDSILRPTEAH